MMLPPFSRVTSFIILATLTSCGGRTDLGLLDSDASGPPLRLTDSSSSGGSRPVDPAPVGGTEGVGGSAGGGTGASGGMSTGGMCADCDPEPADAIHVDCSRAESGDGSSWPTAFNHPSLAMDFALDHPGQSAIWIRSGICRPLEAKGSVLHAMGGRLIIGGFAGTETSLDQRQLLEPTVFSGDFLANDSADHPASFEDNSSHVVHMLGTAHLAHLTITDGHTPDSETYGGGGIFVEYATLASITDVSVQKSRAYEGGGIYVRSDSEVTIDRVNFLGNEADLSGGGIAVEGATVTVANSLFQENRAPWGGGIASIGDAPSLTVEGSHFEKNFAHARGGALDAQSGELSVADTFFLNNSSGGNGGAVTVSAASSLIEDSFFIYNNANANGGAVSYLAASGDGMINRSAFAGNTSGSPGGAISQEGSMLTIGESSFEGNRAYAGGALYAVGASTAVNVLTCHGTEFRENSSESVGALAYITTGAIDLTECTIVGHSSGATIGSLIGLNRGTAQIIGSRIVDLSSGGVRAFSIGQDSTLSVRNSALYSTSPLVFTHSGSGTVNASNNCSSDDLSVHGAGNVLLSAWPFEDFPQGDPFQSPSNPCQDAGDDLTADAHTPGWMNRRTIGGTFDFPPVDSGYHHAANEARILTVEQVGDAVTWTTENASRCWLFPGPTAGVFEAPESDVETGEFLSTIGLADGPHFVCRGDDGRIKTMRALP